MNYIQRLQTENEELRAMVEAAQNELQAFRAYMASSKFNCGDSLDRYINTSDALIWVQSISDCLR